jgi:hypothetical protein
MDAIHDYLAAHRCVLRLYTTGDTLQHSSLAEITRCWARSTPC